MQLLSQNLYLIFLYKEGHKRLKCEEFQHQYLNQVHKIFLEWEHIGQRKQQGKEGTEKGIISLIQIIYKRISNINNRYIMSESAQQKQQPVVTVETVEKQGKKKQKKEKVQKQAYQFTEQEKKQQQFYDAMDEFSKIDFRVGMLQQVWVHPESTNLYCTKVDIGFEQREIGTGLQEHVPLADMKGKVLIMSNIKARKLAGFDSNGMIMAVEDPVTHKFQVVHPDGEVGTRVSVQGYKFDDNPSQVMSKNKAKAVDKCLPLLKTDEEGFIRFKGVKLVTLNEKYIQCKTKNGSVS